MVDRTPRRPTGDRPSRSRTPSVPACHAPMPAPSPARRVAVSRGRERRRRGWRGARRRCRRGPCAPARAAGPARAASLKSASSSSSAAGRPWAAASASGSTPWGVPKSCSKRSAATSVAWGRNEKMPPPSLSTTTMREVGAARGRAPRSPLRVVQERDVADEQRRSGPPTASATPTAVETTPSIPLAPRLATWRTPSRGRGVPLDVAHRHGRRRHQRRPVGQRRRPAAGDAPVPSAGPRQPARRRWRPGPASSARRHRAGHGVRAPARNRADRTRQTVRGRPRHGARDVPSGSTHAADDVTCTCSAPDAASHWASTLEAGGRPSRSDDGRGVIGGEPGVAQQVVEGSHRGRPGQAAAGPGIGEDRPTGRRGQRVHGLGVARAGTGDDDAPAADPARPPARRCRRERALRPR